MSINIDSDSIVDLCEGSDHAMIYGYQHCSYSAIHYAFSDDSENSGVKRVFTGDPMHPDSYAGARTLADRRLEALKLDKKDRSYTKRFCKYGLVSVVWENFLRSQEGSVLIPVVFCIDKEKSAYEMASAEQILSKSKKESHLITHSEIRRAYKLCFDERVPLAIREVALKTFKFVRVVHSRKESDDWSLERVRAPWDQVDWKERWDERKSISTSKPKKISWYREINRLYKDQTKPTVKDKLLRFFNPF